MQVSALQAGEPAGRVNASHREPWLAGLDLRYVSRDGHTVPGMRKHFGPLRVLKGYRPDGADCWEQVIVHPPGGIASCDKLSINIGADPDAHVLLTTPGATKWYRAGDDPRQERCASQRLRVELAAQASLEWMPLENIFYDGVQAHLENSFELQAGAAMISAEISCLGRPVGAAPFRRGRLGMRTRIARAGRLIFHERIGLSGQDRALSAPAGLNNHPCFGSLIAVPAQVEGEDHLKDLVSQLRASVQTRLPGVQLAATALPEVILVRWRGDNAELGWQALRHAWRVLREPLLGLAPQAPRIWAC